MADEQKSILCVDDGLKNYFAAPAEGTLQSKLERIYCDTGYKLVFADTYEAFNEAISRDKDNSIALAILDYELNFGARKDIHAPKIVGELETARPDIRIIFLTTRLDRKAHIKVNGLKKTEEGKRKETGHISKKVDYVAKQDLAEKAGYLRNISRAIIDDYNNDALDVLWEPEQGALTLSRKKDGANEEYTFPIGQSFSQVITWCLRRPGKWAGPFWSKNIIGKATEAINNAIRTKTKGSIWGILDTEDAPPRCLRALVNPKNVKIEYRPAPIKCKKGDAPCDCLDAFERLDARIKKMAEDFDDFQTKYYANKSGLQKEVDVIYDEGEKGKAAVESRELEKLAKRMKKLGGK